MKNKHWIVLLAAVFALCLGLSLFLLLPRQAGAVQVISRGAVLHTLPLSVDTEVTVQTDLGCNVVTVRAGKVAVTQADCPDHYCMDRGFCSGGAGIVCLPNRLVLRFTGKQSVDTVTG